MERIKLDLIDRLTGEEFLQVEKLSVGDIFYHFNLQHSGIPTQHFKDVNKYVGRIINHGTYLDGVDIYPEIDFENLIPVRMLEIRHSVSLQEMSEWIETEPTFILHSQKGVVDSLLERYGPVRGVTRDQILTMSCFVRKFQLL